MPYPKEYQTATMDFQNFLADVKKNASFESSHMAYTMAQGVFQTFRRRLSLKDAILFANILPVGLLALFVSKWVPEERKVPFESRENMNKEVGKLRPEHNFSFQVEDPILEVAKALRNQVNKSTLDAMLQKFPAGAVEFWSTI